MPTGNLEHFAKIRVIGVGGGGGNAVNRMVEAGVTGIDFVAVNTDYQALQLSQSPHILHIGSRVTRGLGAGGNPEMGRKAAEESSDELSKIVNDVDMVFVTAGMGGGTGTGAAPEIARMARENGALTIGVVTKPFSFEGSKRQKSAEEGLARLREVVDTLIIIPNDRLLELTDQRISLEESFRMADDVLRQGIQGISELITVPGLINLDFADVRAIMSSGGAALMAVGEGRGENRGRIAAEQALSNRLLDVSIDGAKGVLFNVTAGPDLSLHEVNQAAAIIRDTTHPDANVIFGAVIDEGMGDALRLTVIATGFEESSSSSRRNPFVTSARVRQEIQQSSSDPAPRKAPEFAPPARPVQESPPPRRQEPARRQEPPRRVEAAKRPPPNRQRPPRRELRQDVDNSPEQKEEKGINGLDIPAFLRRR